MDVYCQLYISFDLNYLSEELFENLKLKVNLIAKELSALIKAYKIRLEK